MNFDRINKALKLSDSCRKIFILDNNYRRADQIINAISLLKVLGYDNQENLEVYKDNLSLEFKIDTSNIKSFDELTIILKGIQKKIYDEARNIYFSGLNDTIKEEILKKMFGIR